MDRVLFGDNQFFGINHMSEERARAQAMRFQDLAAICEVLDHARDEGVRTFMCTTHERVADVCDHVRARPESYRDYLFYPCMPYAHKYANAATEHGILGALKEFLPDQGALGALWQGAASVASRDVEGLAQLLIDAEMKMFQGLRTPVVFLQSVMTDLLLGLGVTDAFRMFANHVSAKYGAEPGFVTMNLPRLLDALDRAGVDNPIVCANVNKIGFRMCGGVDAYRECFEQRRFRGVAMSVLASGALPPREAIEWVCALPNLKSIVFGASSRANIRQTKRLIDECWGEAN